MSDYVVWKRDGNDEELLIQILNEEDLSSVKKEFLNKGYVIVNKYSDHYFKEIFLNMIRVDDKKVLEQVKKFITDIHNKPSVMMTEPKDKYYRVFIRQYSIMYDDYLCYVKLIKTDDLYHWIGYYYSTTLEHVKRIDYQEIDEETFDKEKPRTYYKGELI